MSVLLTRDNRVTLADEMSTTLALDASKRLFLPPGLLEQANWGSTGKVTVEIDAQRIVMTPALENEPEARLVNKRGRLVISGLPPATNADVIAAIKAGREEHEDGIAKACGA